MAVPQTTNGFDKLSDPELQLQGDEIVTKTTDNDYFTGIQPQVQAVAVGMKEFRELSLQASFGNKQAIAERKAKRLQVITLLRQLGKSVDGIAQGNMVILVSSGFPISKNRTSAPPLVDAVAPVVTSGPTSGQIVALGDKQYKTNGIMFSITTDPASGHWQSFITKKSKFTFTGLQSGVKYSIKYTLAGPNEQTVSSPVVTYIAQ